LQRKSTIEQTTFSNILDINGRFEFFGMMFCRATIEEVEGDYGELESKLDKVWFLLHPVKAWHMK